MTTDKLVLQLKSLEEIIKGMNPKHYKVKSEYHRLMYGYTLEIETIKKIIKNGK